MRTMSGISSQSNLIVAPVGLNWNDRFPIFLFSPSKLGVSVSVCDCVAGRSIPSCRKCSFFFLLVFWHISITRLYQNE